MPNHPFKWWVHSRLLKLSGALPDREFIVKRQGLVWRLNPADFMQQSLFWHGCMDSWDLFHLKSRIDAGTVFFDIGSNIGYYSLTIAQALAGQCRINAFEPNPSTFEKLSRNIQSNSMSAVINAHSVALSDRVETGHLVNCAGNSGASHLSSLAGGVPVAVTTLDAFMERSGMDRLDVVKIDVEGYEIRVLRGAQSTLSRFKPDLLIEFDAPRLRREGATVSNLAGELHALGYDLYQARRERLVPVVTLPPFEGPVNIFAFHKARPY